MPKLKNQEKMLFLSFLNTGGYVLDFSNATFANFTMDVLNVSIQEKYGGSKGSSLEQYIYDKDTSDSDAKKLIRELIKHYEYSSQIDREKNSNNVFFREHYEQYLKIKKYEHFLVDDSMENDSFDLMAKDINSEYIKTQIEIMIENQQKNPTESIGKAKELLESICKTILDNLGEEVDEKWELQTLTKKTYQKLKLTPDDISDQLPLAQTLKQILAGLANISNGMAGLRNAYGSGHGKTANFKGLQERHAKLAINATAALVNFLWDCYIEQNKK